MRAWGMRVYMYVNIAHAHACMPYVIHSRRAVHALDWVTAASMKSYQSEVSDFCKVSASHVLPLKVVANRTNIISKNVLDSASWMIQYVRTISSMVASLFHSRTETVVMSPHLSSVNQLTWFLISLCKYFYRHSITLSFSHANRASRSWSLRLMMFTLIMWLVIMWLVIKLIYITDSIHVNFFFVAVYKKRV